MIRKVKGKIDKLWAAIALLSIEMAIMLVLFIMALIFFVYLVRRVFFLKNNEFDQKVFDSLDPYVNEATNGFMQFITFFGSHDFLIPANLALIAYFLFIRKHKWYSIKIPAIALSSLLLMVVLKNLFGRSRPLIPLLYEAKGLSFPSGHALMSVSFYGLMCYIVLRTVEHRLLKWSLFALLIIMIILVGFSRIYLRVHYTSDVIAGYCMGLLWLFISIFILQRIERYSKKEIDPVVKKEETVQA